MILLTVSYLQLTAIDGTAAISVKKLKDFLDLRTDRVSSSKIPLALLQQLRTIHKKKANQQQAQITIGSNVTKLLKINGLVAWHPAEKITVYTYHTHLLLALPLRYLL